MSTQETTDTPRVWIGSLAAYNNGDLVGEWTDATDLEELETVAARVVAKGGGEEFALFDRDGFGGLIGEYTPLETVAAIAGLIEHHGPGFALYCANHGLSESDAAEAEDDFLESYAGAWRDGADYAEHLAEETGAVSTEHRWPLGCIDWDRAWIELTHDGYWEERGHVFRPV